MHSMSVPIGQTSHLEPELHLRLSAMEYFRRTSSYVVLLDGEKSTLATR